MAEAVLSRRSVVKNEYELLADITVSSATTNIDITGLSIGKDEEIVLVSTIYNSTDSLSNIELFFNANVTSTNYYVQRLIAEGTSVTGVRLNSARLMYNEAGLTNFNISIIKLTNNGYIVAQSTSQSRLGLSTFFNQTHYQTSTFTSTSIASLRIASSIANAIGIGSRFQLYKVAK